MTAHLTPPSRFAELAEGLPGGISWRKTKTVE